MFNSAIQTLSEMAIADNGTKIPQTTKVSVVEEVKSFLDGLDTIPVSECKFSAEMVPVRESKRFGKYLIEMEDLSRFMLTNNISSVTEAIGSILECNGLKGQYHNTALIIDEASILDEMSTLGIGTDENLSKWHDSGLGKGLWGDQANVMTYRKFANTKQMMDTFTGKYGIQLIKKNYKVGLAEAAEQEDVQLKVEPTDQVIHEKPVEAKKAAKASNKFIADDIESEDIGDDLDDMMGLGDIESDDDDKDLEEIEEIQESLDPHQQHLQYLRDVAAGKYDKDLM